jgi:hypothetical protein
MKEHVVVSKAPDNAELSLVSVKNRERMNRFMNHKLGEVTRIAILFAVGAISSTWGAAQSVPATQRDTADGLARSTKTKCQGLKQ